VSVGEVGAQVNRSRLSSGAERGIGSTGEDQARSIFAAAGLGQSFQANGSLHLPYARINQESKGQDDVSNFNWSTGQLKSPPELYYQESLHTAGWSGLQSPQKAQGIAQQTPLHSAPSRSDSQRTLKLSPCTPDLPFGIRDVAMKKRERSNSLPSLSFPKPMSVSRAGGEPLNLADRTDNNFTFESAQPKSFTHCNNNFWTQTQVVPSPTSSNISLTEWIKGAVESIDRNNKCHAIATSMYLAAALRIAISLTEKLQNMESSNERFGLIKAGSPLVECVRIRLKTNNDEDLVSEETSQHQCDPTDDWPLPFNEVQSADEILSIDADGFNLDADLHASDKWLNYDETLSLDGKLIFEGLDEALTSDDHNKKTLDASEEDKHTNKHNRDSLRLSWLEEKNREGANGTLDYLNVESASFQFTRDESFDTTINTDVASNNKVSAIFHLGLVLYELFSGGETPPPSLIELPSANEAFFSLPRLSLVERYDNDGDSVIDAKRQQGPSRYNKEDLCNSSIERLRLIGVPGPICSLIFNMLDCVYGDMSGKECYQQIRDVASDLRLMHNKPKYLQELNVGQLALVGLQSNDIAIPREDELMDILSCYRRCVSGSREIAMIVGESGNGKTFLAERVGESIKAQGGLFLRGKFDQFVQAKPFSALASAFDGYIEVLVRIRESDLARCVIHKIHEALGQDACHLIQVLPRLGQVLDGSGAYSTDSISNQDSGNAVQRLYYIFSQFVDAITTASNLPVALFLDDVQWADEASISVLSWLLRRENNTLFFLGCCRENQMTNHPFWNMINKLSSSFGIQTTKVQLKCMEADALNDAISDMLCLVPRVVQPLSAIVHQRTKGNTLFVSQLLLSLYRDGLIYLDLSRGRWVWDEDKILSSTLPDNIANCFTNGISLLPVDVQLSMHTLSMFGASAKSDYLKCLESQLDVKILGPLEVAVAEGLVMNIKGSYAFTHDSIQEACYKMIEGQDRLCNHLEYGRCLVKLALETENADLLFTAVGQMNRGGPIAVTKKEDYIIIANHNVTAGIKAMSMSEFHTAYNLFNHGISYLRVNHWTEHYQLSLRYDHVEFVTS
jgi:hypothetical protein